MSLRSVTLALETVAPDGQFELNLASEGFGSVRWLMLVNRGPTTLDIEGTPLLGGSPLVLAPGEMLIKGSVSSTGHALGTNNTILVSNEGEQVAGTFDLVVIGAKS